MSDSKELNLKENNSKYTILAKSLFVFYLIVSGNYLGNLFGCKTQQVFNENMYVKHLLGFFTLYFFISLVETSDVVPTSLTDRFVFAFVVYIWFIISTRIEVKYWLVLIILLCIIYVLQLNIESENKKELPDSKKIENISKIQKIILYISVIITIIGFLIYLGEKKHEYKKSFNYSTFFSGVAKCKNDDYDKIKLGSIDSIKVALNLKK